MFNTAILDVAIGMIFVYLLLSLICSAANEVIELWFKNRAVDLERGLRELLREPISAKRPNQPAQPNQPDASPPDSATAANTALSPGGLVQKIYTHPLIFGLFEGSYDRSVLGLANRIRGKVNLPSYIPARNFALALMDTVLPGTATAADAKSGAAGALAATAPDAADSLKRLRGGIQENIANLDVRQALVTLVDAAGNDVAKARANIEDWFNSSMDRVSGWYKRRSQYIVLAIGFTAIIVVNADSIDIARRLSSDRALRESMVAAADAYAKASASPSAAAPKSEPKSETKPVVRPDPCWEEECKDNAGSPQCKLKQSQCQLQDLGLPIGWNQPADPHRWTGWTWSGGNGGWWDQIYYHFFGWVLTALAVSLGAPFWFDMLNKFIVVRSTVKPKEKSPEEQSKD